MARSNGDTTAYRPLSNSHDESTGDDDGQTQSRREAQDFLAQHAEEGQNFTVRGILVGLAVGLIICFSNMYFGLQTGWVSSMAMPSSLIGFAFFKSVSKHLDLPFTPVENVLVQTVAGSMGTMPLGCGFVGVMPALNYMLREDEGGPLFLSTWKLIIWALGLCFFGVVFAVPLRRQVIIREKLKFPSGTATALMIGVLHGKEAKDVTVPTDHLDSERHAEGTEERSNDLMPRDVDRGMNSMANDDMGDDKSKSDWKARVRLLLLSFAVSGVYTLCTYFIPILRNLPIFGSYLASTWLWTFNPSFAYIGQGIIMGPATTNSMLLGAIIGWGILSPLAKHKDWAPGPVDDWEHGSKGWIVWVSLAIMLADAVVSLGYIAGQPLLRHGPSWLRSIRQNIKNGDWSALLLAKDPRSGYSQLDGEGASTPLTSLSPTSNPLDSTDTSAETQITLAEPDAPPAHLVSTPTVTIGMIASLVLCILSIHLTFGSLIPLYATILALPIALLLSIMGVRALGETDLNPVSGISKIAQLFFALVIPASNKNAVLINLVAGAVAEAGALQAGDLMQDLKTGHLLGASPAAQFWGQIIGSAVGAVVSAAIYRLYTTVYAVPGPLFQVPTGYVWIFTARLVTGAGLPPQAATFSASFAAIFTITTLIRTWAKTNSSRHSSWTTYIPGGIAVAVGMYNVPSFTLARAVGGWVSAWWRYRGGGETPLVVVASGFVLGEGVVSILNLVLASLGVGTL